MIKIVEWLHTNGEWEKNSEYWINWWIKTYNELKKQLKSIHGSDAKVNQYWKWVFSFLDQLKIALLEKESSHIDPITYLSFLYFNPNKEKSLRDISKKLKEDFEVNIQPTTLGQYFTDKFEWEVRSKNCATKKRVEKNRKTNRNNQKKKQYEVTEIIEDIKRNKSNIDNFDIDIYISISTKTGKIQYLLESYWYIEENGLEVLIEMYQSDNYSDRKITIALDTIIRNIIIEHNLKITLEFSKHRISLILNRK